METTLTENLGRAQLVVFPSKFWLLPDSFLSLSLLFNLLLNLADRLSAAVPELGDG